MTFIIIGVVIVIFLAAIFAGTFIEDPENIPHE